MNRGKDRIESAAFAKLWVLVVFILLAAAVAVVLLVYIDDVVVADGTVHPDVGVEVHSLVPGIILKVHMEPGASVKAGAPLVTLDDKRLRDALAQAKEDLVDSHARLQIAQLNLQKLKKDPLPTELRHADLHLQEAKEKRRRAAENLTRKEQLFRKGLISSEELEQARSEHKLAELTTEVAQKNVDIVSSGLGGDILKAATAGISLIKQEIDTRQAQIARLEEGLSRTRITAPVAGTVVHVSKQDGEAVQAGELVGILALNDRFRIIGWVPERFAAKLKPGQSAEIYSSQFDYHTFGICKGVVDKIDSWAEEYRGGSHPRRGYRVEVIVNEAPYKPRMNSVAQARIKVGRKRLIKFLLGLD